MNSQNQLYCFLTTQVIVDSSAVVFVVHIFTILDFGEFGNYKTELVSRIYSGAKLADCQELQLWESWNPTCSSISSVTSASAPPLWQTNTGSTGSTGNTGNTGRHQYFFDSDFIPKQN